MVASRLQPARLRYRAFMSYSHADRQIAEWLHRKLEGYRVPRSLVGQPTVFGPTPSRPGRIFRDDAEFSASENLGAAIEEALAESAALIVLCSPEAARSQWVNAEIKRFAELQPSGKVFALAVAGSGSAIVPPALLQQGRREQALGSEPFIPHLGQGRNKALTRLAASLLGLRFDDLYRRERRRRFARSFGAVAAVTTAVLLVTYATIWSTHTARSRAFAAAAAYEINQGQYDRAAFLALSGLPKPGSLLDVFWPEDAEKELRRTGLHQIRAEKFIKDVKEGRFSILKEKFLVTQDRPEEFVLTGILSGAVKRRSFAKACRGARDSGGGGDGCVLYSFDSDDEGKRLLLGMLDGSAWRVEADGSAEMLRAPQCRTAWKTFAAGYKISDHGPCKHVSASLSSSGRFGVLVSKAGTVTGYDFEAGTSRVLDDSRECDAEKTEESKSSCLQNLVSLAAFSEGDVVVRRRGRTTWWFLREGGVMRDLPLLIDEAVYGPYRGITGYSHVDNIVTLITPLIHAYPHRSGDAEEILDGTAM